MTNDKGSIKNTLWDCVGGLLTEDELDHMLSALSDAGYSIEKKEYKDIHEWMDSIQKILEKEKVGYSIVPNEPTEESLQILETACEAWGDPEGIISLRSVYQAMIKAAGIRGRG